jgi:SDR family mycofactocin-dependent oxidoreductase
MGQFDGKVAFITGVARGQGRSHAVMLASEGANIIGVDICEQIDTVLYPLASESDLADTVSAVEAVGGKILARKADVRSRQQLAAVFAEGLEMFGRCDIAIANAGILAGCGPDEFDIDQTFRDSIDTILVGAWNTIRVAVPSMVEGNDGGTIIIIGSTASTVGMSDGSAGLDGYVAAKHGLVGLMRAYANILAKHSIRVNIILPTGVNTLMVNNDYSSTWISGDSDHSRSLQNPMPISAMEPEDVSRAVLFLASQDARYITGLAMTVDAGFTNKV